MRAALRPLRSLKAPSRRFNSSSSSSSSSSSNKAPNPLENPQVQKAMENAQKVYTQGVQAVGKLAGPVGDKVGNALGGYKAPLIYNAQVVSSLARQVYKAEKLAFPTDIGSWARAYSQIYSSAINPGYWKNLLKTGAWAATGIVAVEAYGIFCLGEMIGRRNLVGYKLKDEEVKLDLSH